MGEIGFMACPNISAKSTEIKIFLAIGTRLLRDILGRLLGKQTGIRVTGATGSFESFPKQVMESECDVVLTDLSPVSGNSHRLRDLHQKKSRIRILLISMEDDAEIFMKAIRLGASGYVLKDAPAMEIVSTVRQAGRGEAICPPHLLMGLLEHLWREERRSSEGIHSTGATSRLTHRQVQLMNMVADGLSNKEIATSLNLSQYTVKNHLRRVMRQVDATNRYDAVELIRASGRLDQKRSSASAD